MKILRYLDPEGRIYHGEQKADNHVERLEGDLFAGLAPTGEPARVQKILAPLVPVAILCIGLNYKHHAAESGMKAPELPILFGPQHPPESRRPDRNSHPPGERQSGACLREIRVPCSQPTSCRFGGPQGDSLLITTARTGLSEDELAQQPLAGSVFVCRGISDSGHSGAINAGATAEWVMPSRMFPLFGERHRVFGCCEIKVDG